jgi:hypothetical protein
MTKDELKVNLDKSIALLKAMVLDEIESVYADNDVGEGMSSEEYTGHVHKYLTGLQNGLLADEDASVLQSTAKIAGVTLLSLAFWTDFDTTKKDKTNEQQTDNGG